MALDGDVYNLEELAREAAVERSLGDVPLLAALYRRLGEDLLPRLRGDFLLVVWDERERSGLLVRDQTAGRALVHRAEGGRLLFASEVKHLLPLLPRAPEPDTVGMAHWIGASAPPGDRTLYAGVRRLRAGHLLRLRGRPTRPERYWEPRYTGVLEGSPQELGEGLRDVLAQAVRRRLPTTERTGLLLSGGLDSSGVAAIASRLMPPGRRPSLSYSAVFPRHPSIDESSLIAKLARDNQLQAVCMEVRRGSLFPGTVDYLRNWRVPPTSPNPLLLESAVSLGGRVRTHGPA